MSKLTTRIALSVLISLVVIAGIYTTVFGAPSNASDTRAGSHLVSGAKVNLDHYREANPAPAPLQSDFQSDKGSGHNCESESFTSPED
jgi:hypothetical protein